MGSCLTNLHLLNHYHCLEALSCSRRRMYRALASYWCTTDRNIAGATRWNQVELADASYGCATARTLTKMIPVLHAVGAPLLLLELGVQAQQ